MVGVTTSHHTLHTKKTLKMAPQKKTHGKRAVISILMTEFRQPIQVQSHQEMPGILVQLGHIQLT